jgi:Kdo2-lipid IVA lauroyltransferase/acyltransferase
MISGAAATLLALPYPLRAPLAQHLVGLAARFGPLPDRIAQAVHHFRPDLPTAEAARIARAVPGNLARMAIENLSGRAFARQVEDSPIEGPGVAALEAARAAGRPAILVTAHFGNYDAARAALLARGYPLAAVYRPFPDPVLNARYVKAMLTVGEPMFATTREGVGGMVRHLRGGGMIGILIDLDREEGVLLDVMGQPTRTVLTMAQLALRHDALLVPVWAIRQPDPRRFVIRIDAEVPHSEPLAMTQALNDAFSTVVRAHPDQWLWWHNRRRSHHP